MTGTSSVGAVVAGIVFTLFVLLACRPPHAMAAPYEIRDLAVVVGTSTLNDAFSTAVPPPEGPLGPATYGTFGVFVPGDEHDGLLTLETSRGGVDLAQGRQIISAQIFDSGFRFSPGVSGSAAAVFTNLLPAVGDAYTLVIDPVVAILGTDFAFLTIANPAGTPVAAFVDETGVRGFQTLSGVLTGTGEIGLSLGVSSTGIVTAFLDIDGTGPGGFSALPGTSTLQALGTGTHSFGFSASQPVPEPSALSLIGSGVAVASGLAWRLRRRSSATTPGELAVR